MTAFITGIKSKKQVVNNTMKAVAASGVTEARKKYESFKNAGKYVVDGFVKGIDINTYKAEAEAAAMAKAAYDAAMAAIGAASPAKKFIDVGMFADQGLAIGLLKYATLATKASAGLGRGVVESMQDELDINSPAKVVKDDVGKYIVEGLAEGIKNDMSAEEAAQQKAKNIVDAFKKELEKQDLDMETADLEYEKWMLLNPGASLTEQTKAKSDAAYKRIAAQTEKVLLAQGEYENTLKEFGEGSTETQEAYNKYLKEQISLTEENNKLLELRNEELEAASRHMETADLEYELWESQNESASYAEKSANKAGTIYKRIAAQTDRVAIAQHKYQTAFNTFGATAAQTQEAYNEFLSEQIALNNETKSLLELRQESIDNATEAADLNMETTDLEHEKWSTENSKATDVEKETHELDNLLDNIPEQAKKVGLAKAAWQAAVEQFGEGSNEAKTAYNDFLKSEIDLATMTDKASGLYENAINRNRTAQIAYLQWMKEHKQEYLDYGLSEEDIDKIARTETGYNPDFLKNLPADISDAANTVDNIIESTYRDAMKLPTDELVKDYVATGEETANGVSEGIMDATPGVTSAVQTFSDACTVAMTPEQEASWVELGKTMVLKFVEGITNATTSVTEATVTMVTSAYQSAVDFINSPENVGFTPRITPILDLSNVQNGVGQINGMFATSTVALADINVKLTNDSVTELNNIADEMRRSNESNHIELMGAINNIRGDLSSLADAIDGMNITMDGNTVVGKLIGKIDTRLGEIAQRKGRGN